MRIVDDAGKPIDASFSVEGHDRLVDVILHARGGTRGTSAAVNVEYAAGLHVLLDRLAALRASLRDALLDSSRVASLPEVERRLSVGEFPIDLAELPDTISLGKEIQRAQLRPTTSVSRTLKGNSTRRIRLRVELPSDLADDADGVARVLSGVSSEGAPWPRSSAAGVAIASRAQDSSGAFDPKNDEDARRRVSRAIALRQGQPAFRRALLHAYKARCAVTGCGVESLLEAAHVKPYRGPQTNHIQNGMLLRADIHTLFDRGLLAIDAEARRVTTWRIAIAPTLWASEYAAYMGKSPRLPLREPEQPSLAAIQDHRSRAAF